MLGQIGFIFATTKETLKNEFISYSGKSLSWNQSKDIMNEHESKMLTLDEARDLIKKNGKQAFFPGEDQWAAVVRSDGEKDWVQLGDKHHHPGKSHVDDCGEYPQWGDKLETFVWRNCIMF